LISARPSAEINLEERQFEDGKEPQILDVIEVPRLAPVPRVHQAENHMIDADPYWIKKGVIARGALTDLIDGPPSLWTNGDSTFHGRNDRVTQAVAFQFRDSLFLIRPTNAAIGVLTPGAAFGKGFVQEPPLDYPISVTMNSQSRFRYRLRNNYRLQHRSHITFFVFLLEKNMPFGHTWLVHAPQHTHGMRRRIRDDE
jgi:hypothetical protein